MQRERQHIDTVVFDIGGVLTQYNPRLFYRSQGFSEEMTERIFRATNATPHWAEYDRGVLGDGEILSLFQKDAPEIADEIARALSNTHGLVRRSDHAIPWIRKVKETGRQVLVLSNFSRKVKEECADALDFLPETDGGILSYRDHCIKPDPIIYALLTSRYRLDPSHCVFIDDTMENLTAARDAGFWTIHYENQAQAEALLDEMMTWV